MGYAFGGVVEYAADRFGIKSHRVGEYDVYNRTLHHTSYPVLINVSVTDLRNLKRNFLRASTLVLIHKKITERRSRLAQRLNVAPTIR